MTAAIAVRVNFWPDGSTARLIALNVRWAVLPRGAQRRYVMSACC